MRAPAVKTSFWAKTTAVGLAARLYRNRTVFRLNGHVLKKIAMLLIVGFAVYYLLTAPAGAADAVRNAFGAVIDGFGQVNVFVNNLFSS